MYHHRSKRGGQAPLAPHFLGGASSPPIMYLLKMLLGRVCFKTGSRGSGQQLPLARHLAAIGSFAQGRMECAFQRTSYWLLNILEAVFHHCQFVYFVYHIRVTRLCSIKNLLWLVVAVSKYFSIFEQTQWVRWPKT